MVNRLLYPALYETQRVLAFGSIGVGYTAIGTSLANPARIVKVYNLTDGTLQFSVVPNSVTPFDCFTLSAGGVEVIDYKANELLVEVGTLFYVKRIDTPTTGSVYVSVIYGR